MSATDQKEYRFSYVLDGKRFYTKICSPSMEAAHEQGKQIALEHNPEAHAFLTERSIYEGER